MGKFDTIKISQEKYIEKSKNAVAIFVGTQKALGYIKDEKQLESLTKYGLVIASEIGRELFDNKK